MTPFLYHTGCGLDPSFGREGIAPMILDAGIGLLDVSALSLLQFDPLGASRLTLASLASGVLRFADALLFATTTHFFLCARFCKGSMAAFV